MTENKRFTVIRKKNPVSKEIGNYVQDRGTTILKLGFLEDCKDVCDILNELHDENKKLKHKNSQLQETLAFRSNQLALMERLVDDLGSEEMARQMEEILND